MNNLKIGDQAPDFKLTLTSDRTVTLNDFKGGNLLLYFYPKDNTPGCSIEAYNFNNMIEDFRNLDTSVIGVSRDDICSHNNFKDKLGLIFDLGFDQEGDIYKNYGVLVERSIFGKKFLALTRSTFLINKEGKIVYIWPKVDVRKHVDEVLKIIKKIC